MSYILSNKKFCAESDRYLEPIRCIYKKKNNFFKQNTYHKGNKVILYYQIYRIYAKDNAFNFSSISTANITDYAS